MVADIARAGEYEAISEYNFSNRVQRKTVWCKVPFSEQVTIPYSFSPEIICS